MKLHVIQATDVRMIQGTTAEEILAESHNVLETNGEWVLADITVASSNLALDVGSYSAIEYHVSTFYKKYVHCFSVCKLHQV